MKAQELRHGLSAEVLRWFSPMPPSEADVPVERYTSAEFHRLEVDKVWTKVWQMRCWQPR